MVRLVDAVECESIDNFPPSKPSSGIPQRAPDDKWVLKGRCCLSQWRQWEGFREVDVGCRDLDDKSSSKTVSDTLGESLAKHNELALRLHHTHTHTHAYVHQPPHLTQTPSSGLLRHPLCFPSARSTPSVPLRFRWRLTGRSRRACQPWVALSRC